MKNFLVIIICFLISEVAYTQNDCASLDFLTDTETYVDLPSSKNYLNGGGSFTWEMWFMLTDSISMSWKGWGQQMFCIDVQNSYGDDYFIGWGHSPDIEINKLSFYLYDEYLNLPGGTINGGEWYFVAGTYDASTQDMSFYVYDANGNNIGGTPLTKNVPNVVIDTAKTKPAIGRLPYSDVPASYFKGRIDEFRIWDYARTQSSIETDMYKCMSGDENGLKVYFPVLSSENGNSVIANYSNNNNDVSEGTLVNSPLFDSQLYAPLDCCNEFDCDSVMISFTNTTGCCFDFSIENHSLDQTIYTIQLGAKNSGYEFTSNYTMPTGWTATNTTTSMEIDIPGGLDNVAHSGSICFNKTTAQQITFDFQMLNDDGDTVCTERFVLNCTMPQEPPCDSIDIKLYGDPERPCCYELRLNNTIPQNYLQPYWIKASIAPPSTMSIAWLLSGWQSLPPFSGTPTDANVITWATDPFNALYTGHNMEFARLCIEPNGVVNPIINFEILGLDSNDVYCRFSDTTDCDETDCTCDDMSIEVTQYDSQDPDHKCCVEVNIHADCDIPDISSIIFVDNANSAGIANYSSPQAWSQSYGKFTNADGYLAEGDHKFILCIGSDNTNDIEDFELSFEDSNNNKVCNDTTITVSCDGGCCDKSFINTTYWLGPNPPSNWKADENYCTKRQYTWVKLQAGPRPTTRVAMHIVRAIRSYRLFNPLNASETTHIEPLNSFIDAIGTPTSWCPTCNGGIGNPWVGFMGSGNVAPMGFTPYSPPYLPLDFVSCFPAHPQNSHQSRSEIIWGGFNTSPATDISSPNALTGISGQNPPNYGNLVSYRIGFKKTCDCIDQGVILEDTIRYWVRYYVTDETCCTCDTLIEREIIIPQPPNNAVTPPLASISMNNLTSGTLSLQSNFYYPEDLKISSISFETLDDVQIISMKDPISGEEAEIKDNIAYLSGPTFILDSLTFSLEWANPNQDYMFKNKVTLMLESGGSDETELLVYEEYWQLVIAKVPSDENPDLLEQGTLPEDKTMQTIALHLTNMNVYEEPISHIMLQAATEDCKVAAVGRPVDFGEGRAIVGFSERNKEFYVQSSPDRHHHYLDSLYCETDYVIDPGEKVQPLYITVTTPNDFEGPLVLNYETYNAEGIKLSSGQLTTLISGIIKETENPSGIMINCYPNPANTEVTFSINAVRHFNNVSITITDLQGNTVGNVMTNDILNKGNHLIPYNISNLPSGAYYYTIRTDDNTITKLLNIIK
jgi:hypothetical protein